MNYKLLLIFCMELTWLFDIYFLISFPLIYLWYCYAYKGQIAEVHIAMTELAVEKFTVMMCRWFPELLKVCSSLSYDCEAANSIFTTPFTSVLSLPFPGPPFQNLVLSCLENRNIFLIISMHTGYSPWSSCFLVLQDG